MAAATTRRLRTQKTDSDSWVSPGPPKHWYRCPPTRQGPKVRQACLVIAINITRRAAVHGIPSATVTRHPMPTLRWPHFGFPVDGIR